MSDRYPPRRRANCARRRKRTVSEPEVRPRAELAADNAGIMPGGQEVRRAAVSRGRQWRPGVEQVADIGKEGELVVDPNGCVQIDIDERVDVAKARIGVLRRRSRIEIAVRAIERQALILRHRLDLADVVSRRRE